VDHFREKKRKRIQAEKEEVQHEIKNGGQLLNLKRVVRGCAYGKGVNESDY